MRSEYADTHENDLVCINCMPATAIYPLVKRLKILNKKNIRFKHNNVRLIGCIKVALMNIVTFLVGGCNTDLL